MQRPSPLPAPPAPARKEREEVRPVPAADRIALVDRPWPEAPGDAQPTRPQAWSGRDAHPLAEPGIKTASAVAPTVPPALPFDDRDPRDRTDSGASTPDEPLLGVRDVWRAARARRRALRAEVRRFTGRQRRRRLAWTVGAASVVALALATLGAAYSPLFAVEDVSVVSTGSSDAGALDTASVESALSGQLGTPLPLVDASAIKAALVAFPLVESFSLEARPPHGLVVRVVERTPVGVVQGAAGFTLVDAAGVALATTPTAPAGQPLLQVSGGVKGEVFAAVGQVVRALPTDLRAQVTAVSATSVDDVSLVLGGSNTQVVWGSADDSALKATVLATTIRVRPLGSVAVYDVSTPAAVVVR